MTFTWTDAVDVVGAPADDDWDIKPAKHADALSSTGERAAPLIAALTAPEMGSIIDAYTRGDDEAKAAQERFKNAMARAITLSVAAAVFAAATLFYSGGLGRWTFLDEAFALVGLEDAPVGRFLVTAQYVFLIASVFVARGAINGPAFDTWKTRRADAEIGRHNLFRFLLRDTDVSPQALLLKLAYIRRYLWHSQLQYFQVRGGRHSRDADGRQGANTRLGSLSVFIALAFAAMTIYWVTTLFADAAAAWLLVADALATNLESVFGALGLIVASLVAANQAHDALNQDRALAKSYTHQANQLIDYGGPTWDEHSDAFAAARDAAAAGNDVEMRVWTERVIASLEAEHRQWVDTMTSHDDLSSVLDIPAIRNARGR